MCGRCDYRFIAAEAMSEERRNLGWGDEALPDYAIRLDGESEELCRKLIREADAVIAGSAPEKLLRERIAAGKLLFRYSERPLKHGSEPLKYLPRLIKWHLLNPPGKPIYLLCAGAYASADYARFGLFRGKCFQWGYFPPTMRYNIGELMERKDPGTILWCGRFLDWKHPDDVILAAKRLKDEGLSFRLQLIGTGPMEQRLRELVEQNQLSDSVSFCGVMSPDEVRRYMERAGIFVISSDRQEGWGAVVNEAMNSGCAVAAGDAAGSVPYLIRDGENGRVYASGSVDALAEILRELLEKPEQQKSLGPAACRTITELWNAELAAERFLILTGRLLSGRDAVLFSSGPCSRADKETEALK